MTFESHFSYYERFHFLSKNIAYRPNVLSALHRSDIIMRATIFFCRIQPEGLFHDAERDLLAVANFLVYNCSGRRRE